MLIRSVGAAALDLSIYHSLFGKNGPERQHHVHGRQPREYLDGNE
jgi:hypothetical protein